MGYRLGVDLGTTYTAAAVNVDGRVEMLGLGMAGVANATVSTAPAGPGYSYAPSVKAKPAAQGQPHMHGVVRVETMVPGYHR